jgi:hypothetical protein
MLLNRLDYSTPDDNEQSLPPLLLLLAGIIINLQCQATINKATILFTSILRNNEQGHDIIISFGLPTLHSLLDSFHCTHNTWNKPTIEVCSTFMGFYSFTIFSIRCAVISGLLTSPPSFFSFLPLTTYSSNLIQLLVAYHLIFFDKNRSSWKGINGWTRPGRGNNTRVFEPMIHHFHDSVHRKPPQAQQQHL